MGPTEFIAASRKGKLGPAYFLCGPNRLLHEECRRALISSVPLEARAWCLAEIEFQPGRLARELEGAYQMPMLGGHSLVLFSDPEDFRHASDDDVEALRAWLEHPSSFATVVFSAVEPDRRRRFIQQLEKKATGVDMRPLGREEATAWLEDYLRQAGVHADRSLLEEIVAKFETSGESSGEPRRVSVNLLWLRTEIDKILTAKPGTKRLERADLGLIVAFREEHQIGKLLGAIAERNCALALEELRVLIASKVAETLLLWWVADLFRQALKSGPGVPPRQAWYGQANPFSGVALAPVAATKYSRQELLRALRLIRRSDLGIKSSWKDSKILLDYLVWQIIVGQGEEAEPPIGLGATTPSVEAE